MNQKGISLIELIVVMAIATVIGWVVFSAFLNMNRTVIDQNSVIDVQSSGRNVVGGMVRVLRETGLDPLGSADAGVEEATSTKIRITRNANLKNLIEEGLQERISFSFSDENGDGELELWRCYDEGTSSEAWVNLSDDVQNLTFTYLDADGVDLGSPGTNPLLLSRIRVINLNLSLRDDKAGGGTFSRNLTTTVQGRNL